MAKEVAGCDRRAFKAICFHHVSVSERWEALSYLIIKFCYKGVIGKHTCPNRLNLILL